jgi:hypothetical protein
LKSSYRKTNVLVALSSILVIFSAAPAGPFAPEKMRPEEVVAKHLASIGTPEDIAAAKTRIMIGEVKARLKASNTLREAMGPAQFASDGNKVLLAMVFNSTNYPFEKAGYDGQKLTVAGLPSGGRTALAGFFSSQDSVFKHGLIGGALSSAWPLVSLDPKQAKLSYSGTEKINGREVHKLKYEPRKGDLKISLYFDAETFRHVRSDYQYTVSAYMGARPGAAATDVMGPATPTGGVSRFQLIEDFSDFQPTGKLTLPRVYKIQLVIEALAQNLEYTNTFSQFIFDQSIDPEAFNVARSK